MSIVKLPSGREMDIAHGCVIGLGEDLTPYVGYDDELENRLGYVNKPFTPLERRELAEIMIARWQAYGTSGGVVLPIQELTGGPRPAPATKWRRATPTSRTP